MDNTNNYSPGGIKMVEYNNIKNLDDDIFIDADNLQMDLFGEPILSKDFIMKAIL